MKIAGSPFPPSRVVVVGEDQADEQQQEQRLRARAQPPPQPPQALPAGLGALLHRRHGLGRDGLGGRGSDR